MWVLAMGVFTGLLLPELAALARPMLAAMIAGILFIAMLRVEWSEVFASLSRPALVVTSCLWILVASPLIAWWVANALGLPSPVIVAIVLATALPPLFSAPALALLLGMNGALVLVMTVLCMFIAPFTVVMFAAAVADVALEIRPLELMLRLSALIGGCTIAAIAVRRSAGGKRVRSWSGKLDTIAVAMLLIVSVAIMDNVAARIAHDPTHVAFLIVVSVVLNVVLQALGAIALWPAGGRAALAIGFASGNRSLALLLAVLPASTHPDVLLFFAVGQFPIYILPAVLTPVYRRLVARTAS